MKLRRLNSRGLLVVLGLVILLVLGGYTAYKFYAERNLVKAVETSLSADKAEEAENKIKGIDDRLGKLDKSDETNFERISLLLEKGKIQHSLGDLSGAENTLESASEIDAGRYDVWYELFLVQSEMRDHKDAEASIKQAVSLSSNDIIYWKSYLDFVVFDAPRDKNEVDQLATEAILKTNHSQFILAWYAGYLESQGDNPAALNMWKLALEKDPENSRYSQEIKRLESIINLAK